MATTLNFKLTIGPDGVVAERVYVCRCGQTHTGDYALYDYGHHMCFHETRLLDLGLGQVLCPDCGKSWTTERPNG